MHFAAAALLATLTASPDRLVLHEWGTFTSVSGEDGAPIEWRPLAAPSDLLLTRWRAEATAGVTAAE